MGPGREPPCCVPSNARRTGWGRRALSQQPLQLFLIPREVSPQPLAKFGLHRRIGTPGTVAGLNPVSRQTQKGEHSVHDRGGVFEQFFAPENEQVLLRKVLEPRFQVVRIPAAVQVGEK